MPDLHVAREGRDQNLRLAPEAVGLVSAARPVIAVRGGLTLGDLGPDDLLDVGLGEGAALRLTGAQACRGPREVRTAGARGGGGAGAAGTALALSIAARAVRSAEEAIASRLLRAARRASWRRSRIGVSGPSATIGPVRRAGR